MYKCYNVKHAAWIVGVYVHHKNTFSQDYPNVHIQSLVFLLHMSRESGSNRNGLREKGLKYEHHWVSKGPVSKHSTSFLHAQIWRGGLIQLTNTWVSLMPCPKQKWFMSGVSLKIISQKCGKTGLANFGRWILNLGTPRDLVTHGLNVGSIGCWRVGVAPTMVSLDDFDHVTAQMT